MSNGVDPTADGSLPQQALLAAIVESSNDAIVSKTLDGVIISWNPAAERIFGYAAAEAVGRPITMLLPPERLHEEAMILERLRRGEAVQNFETVRLRKDGTRIDVALTSSPVRDATGRIVGASKIVRDISHQKSIALALSRSESRLAGIVDSAMDAIITVDDTGKVLLFNDAAAAMFGCTPQEALGGTLERFVPARFHASHLQWMSRFGESGRTSRAMGRPGEISAVRADGSEFPVEASISHVRIDGHELYTVIMRDVSELKKAHADRRALEARLRNAQKIEAVGTLAGGIAHDFNNILGSIVGNVGLARLDIDADHPAAESLGQIERAASRARGLVRQILSFSRHQPQELLNQPLQPVLSEALDLLRATLPTIVRIELKLHPEPLHAVVDTTQLHQVVINLCTNAWHALQGSTGRIEVGLAPVELDPAAALQAGELSAGAYAHIWIADNGCGMPEEVRSRIFEPFFTTKARGEGTGLGLSVVHGIVASHGGAIGVESAVGKGSTFHVYLPVSAPDDKADPDADAHAAATYGAGRRVAYIDDDEVMVLMVERLLSRNGFDVTCHRDARTAIAEIAQRPGDWDAIVTDYNMPECSGIDVAGELAKHDPALPVIISSGYISEDLREQAGRLGVRALLEKENTFEELCGLIVRAGRSGPPHASHASHAA